MSSTAVVAVSLRDDCSKLPSALSVTSGATERLILIASDLSEEFKVQLQPVHMARVMVATTLLGISGALRSLELHTEEYSIHRQELAQASEKAASQTLRKVDDLLSREAAIQLSLSAEYKRALVVARLTEDYSDEESLRRCSTQLAQYRECLEDVVAREGEISSSLKSSIMKLIGETSPSNILNPQTLLFRLRLSVHASVIFASISFSSEVKADSPCLSSGRSITLFDLLRTTRSTETMESLCRDWFYGERRLIVKRSTAGRAVGTSQSQAELVSGQSGGLSGLSGLSGLISAARNACSWQPLYENLVKCAGCSIQDRNRTDSETDAMDECWSVASLREGGFTAEDLRIAGYTVGELKSAGYSVVDLKLGGFPLRELCASTIVKVEELLAAGYSVYDLKLCNISARKLLAAGVSAAELRSAGFLFPGDREEFGEVDPIPFALLRKKSPLVMSLVLSLRPHYLTAEDLLKAGCSLDTLEEEGGYTKAELLCVYRTAYRELKTLDLEHKWVSGIAPIGPDELVFATSKDKVLRVLNTSTGEYTATWRAHDQVVRCVVVLRDNTVVTGSNDRSIKHWDPRTGECLRTIADAHREFVWSLAKLADGRVVSGGDFNDKSLKVWDLQTGRCDAVMNGHTDGICIIIQLQDGRIASGSSDRTIRIWRTDTRSGESCVKTIDGHEGVVYALAQLANGLLASGSCGAEVKLWNLNASTGCECVGVLEGHKGGIYSLCTLSDGVTIASGSYDRTIKLWDTRKKKYLKTMKEHSSWVQSLSLLSDGITIVSGSGYNTIKLFSI